MEKSRFKSSEGDIGWCGAPIMLGNCRSPHGPSKKDNGGTMRSGMSFLGNRWQTEPQERRINGGDGGRKALGCGFDSRPLLDKEGVEDGRDEERFYKTDAD